MFEISPFTARFDFGSFGSPAEATYVHVLPSNSYSAEVGYGYESGFVAAVDRFSGSNLERDIHYGNDFAFSVDAPDGLYSVVLTIGDHGPYAHESMGVFLEGQQIDTVSTAPGEVATFTYNDVAVAGGKFELRLLDLGGPDVNAVIAGLELSAHINLAASEVRNTFSADFDGDGFVTGADFLLWQVGVGTPAPNAVRTDGDADNDLDADFSDLDVWELQYGTAAPQVAAASAPISTELSSTKSAPESLLTSGELVDAALAVALEEKANWVSGKREFVAHSPPLKFFSAEPIGRSDMQPASSLSSPANTSATSTQESESPDWPSPWEDAFDEVFASVFK